MRVFDKNNAEYKMQYEEITWLGKTDVYQERLQDGFTKIMQESTWTKAMKKAKLFALIAEEAPIAIDKADIFQDKIYSGGFMQKQRSLWYNAVVEAHLKERADFVEKCHRTYGLFAAGHDFGHTSANSALLLKVGLDGILERLTQYQKENEAAKADFYESCKLTISSMQTIILRLSEGIMPYNRENGLALRNIAHAAPQNTYEAMQLLVVYFAIHEFVYGTRMRNLGRMDLLLEPFYKRDIESGTYTETEMRQLYKFFLYKFWLMKVPTDLPFSLAGMGQDGQDVTNEVSYLIVETYNELNIHSPKMHIRVTSDTPADFIKLVLRCIRKGNSSFVFVNDKIAIKALRRVGISEADARNYVPIGCYEPAVWGVEMGCTWNGGLNLAKIIELLLFDGCDGRSGIRLGEKVGSIETFRDFVEEAKRQIQYFTAYALDFIRDLEGYYMEINPEGILSSMYEHSARTGVDVYKGGAKYNNSSFYYYGIATMVDSLMVIKKIVFEEKKLTLNKLREILQNNWKGQDALRQYILKHCEKYGNGHEEADALAREISDYLSAICINQPNGRGGVFKPALFSIDFCFEMGSHTMATPDGRFSDTPFSKNLCASAGMDKNGITSLIHSVTQIDHSAFPTGSVLDVVLHPTAVAGEKGLDAFYGILKTYFAKGGFAMHGNVFDRADLMAAQENPEAYQNLQVRLCGWNAFFVNLSRTEQDSFIKQTETQ